MSGLFLCIEGTEGSGKSTLQRTIAEHLQGEGLDVVCTREPGATELGRRIRSLLLEPSAAPLDPMSELLLFSADRAQHLAEVIRPALQRNAIVLCDRYIHSTISYQGYGRGLALAELRFLIDYVTAALKPDAVLLLDLDPRIGLSRAKGRRDAAGGADVSWTRFEEEELEFHLRVREGFLTLAKDPEERMHIIDASGSMEDVGAQAIARLTTLLSQRSDSGE